MGKIFTVTTVRRANNPLCASPRTVAWYKTFKSAERAILNNACDMYEDGYYPYAVIEEIGPGMYPEVKKETWFEWDTNKKAYVPCKKPELFKNVVSFSIG